ncbi:isocitrate lyase/PEP mutase family protein [Roseomonas marmotae]|uniref:Isocitrate lyase/phosphoenolpyruvate mutase family protein n=1 Tax=Roseomonas marmotae TaxID=2768161 RepID=A0ABS3KCB7_9PROT|nr:isocitrate lyase/phosphoenolpyruvate mutase family protein [Roseomonas marmotae]MBO1075094.1 isocitrate lyase/phosphoenolpyruvate mutase family protein [Roseomonas marmotae]QTI79789.1 isocitrate lyase/phosphoenolpyruvate mutase family protein [Roseomonas marmotae]
MDQNERAARFRALHARPGAFVIPNPWDAGSARILAALGFEALATTSAGLAFSLGRRDGEGALTREEILANAAAIVAATPLPVSADLENGFGDAPEDCAATIRAAAATGLVGGSIEDASGDPARPIYDFAHAVERVAAAAEAARGLPFVLTARAENFLHGRPELDDTIRRLQAFSAAGAEVLYAPGLTRLEDIRTLCAALDKPVNVVMGLAGKPFTVAELAEAGVKRISLGGSLARAALGALARAGREILRDGHFGFAGQALSGAEAAAFMAPRG